MPSVSLTTVRTCRLPVTTKPENELQDDVNDSCSGSINAAEVSAFLSVHCDGGVSPLPVSSPTSLQLPDEDPSVAIPFFQNCKSPRAGQHSR